MKKKKNVMTKDKLRALHQFGISLLFFKRPLPCWQGKPAMFVPRQSILNSVSTQNLQMVVQTLAFIWELNGTHSVLTCLLGQSRAQQVKMKHKMQLPIL